MFEDYCKSNCPSNVSETFNGAVLILMDSLEIMDDNKSYEPIKSNRFKKHFYTHTGEDGCHMESGRVDPVLKLYYNCPLMLTLNEDVPKGQANGSRLFLRKVHVKAGEEPFIIWLKCGVKVRTFRASQIEKITIKHEMDDMIPRTFDVLVHGFSFKTTLNIDGEEISPRMKGRQFPLISNSATTGHKLQGYTALQLLVWNWHYAENWAYVVLSRVRKMKGLFLRKPLSYDLSKYTMSDDMLNMLEGFREDFSIEFLSDSQYQQLIDSEANFFN